MFDSASDYELIFFAVFGYDKPGFAFAAHCHSEDIQFRLARSRGKQGFQDFRPGLARGGQCGRRFIEVSGLLQRQHPGIDHGAQSIIAMAVAQRQRIDGATGACIVLIQFVVFVLAFLFAPKRGLWANRSRLTPITSP